MICRRSPIAMETRKPEFIVIGGSSLVVMKLRGPLSRACTGYARATRVFASALRDAMPSFLEGIFIVMRDILSRHARTRVFE